MARTSSSRAQRGDPSRPHTRSRPPPGTMDCRASLAMTISVASPARDGDRVRRNGVNAARRTARNLASWLVLGALFPLTPAAAPIADRPRVALVIGNATYSALPALPACTASANVVTAALKRAGFDVAERLDLTNGQMGAAIADWAAKSSGASAVAYVCGYAVGFD